MAATPSLLLLRTTRATPTVTAAAVAGRCAAVEDLTGGGPPTLTFSRGLRRLLTGLRCTGLADSRQVTPVSNVVTEAIVVTLATQTMDLRRGNKNLLLSKALIETRRELAAGVNLCFLHRTRKPVKRNLSVRTRAKFFSHHV
jgi:hypothetical protein